MYLKFEDKVLRLAKYPDDEYYVPIFMQGNAEMWRNVIPDHPNVIGFIYLNYCIITKAFIVNTNINFKTSDLEKKTLIIAVSDDVDRYTHFYTSKLCLFGHNLEFNNFPILKSYNLYSKKSHQQQSKPTFVNKKITPMLR